MWTQSKNASNNSIIDMEYFYFARVKVIEKIKNNGLKAYVVQIHVEDVTDEEIEVLKIEDAQKILVTARDWIEDVYEIIPDLDDSQLNNWCRNFKDALNEY